MDEQEYLIDDLVEAQICIELLAREMGDLKRVQRRIMKQVKSQLSDGYYSAKGKVVEKKGNSITIWDL